MTNEQMRFEAAKAAMQAMITNPQWDTSGWETIAEAAVDAADCLLQQLSRYPFNEDSSVVPDTNDGRAK